ncbi:floricaula/leafy homolog 1-like isoform X1 [Cucurbita pepo subsp. pepo]|uniref:floricaula/leafy homolog 1-like isoform X1 n=1 Tax=Cucurbita pepo subsp. pepo TaxID=3664 RepID=UPI000C9D73FC|nr:floricaula/leafy homolog 1-like isoform X1 [Cucurbita pepo subsp. pepo]
MDPEALSATLFKWDPRGMVGGGSGASLPAPLPPYSLRPRELGLGGLEELFQAYGIRYYTAAKIAELGFTVSTLLDMKDEELEDMMNSLSHIFRWELLVGERYGIKAAIRAERRRLDDEIDPSRRRHLMSNDTTTNVVLDALSQEGLSEEPVQQEKEVVGSGGGGGAWEAVAAAEMRKKQRRRNVSKKKQVIVMEEDNEETEGGGEEEENMEVSERQREHPFIVTEPGEVARGKKNGLDYLFHLYEQCRQFLIQVQNIAKERGEKCPNKQVTNQVFRYAKKAGASYINKPKMRHYVHCYALHCLDEEASNSLRRVFKERGENVGAWRQACYKPLVAIAAAQGWDIDAIFNAHPRLAIWYVPTKLRQLCHAERNSSTASTSAAAALLPF